MFKLNSKLQSDSFFIQDLKLSRLLLMNDSNYSWFILVPRKPNLTEIIELEFEEQIELLHEINLLGKILKENFAAEKLNIAALGNVVKQLHIHVIARKESDVTFPKPVWGNAVSKPYQNEDVTKIIIKVQALIAVAN
jgi:diadenosine tetraphosphate (Ap4A) HIT family hydrolase